MAVKLFGASIDENGRAYGGKAGNQTGRELRSQSYYVHKKGWYVYRAKDPKVAQAISYAVQRAVANRHIGYDQYERNTLYKYAEKVGFDPGKVTTNCETDCSALVRVCCAYAGIKGLPASFRTGNMPENLSKTSAFVRLAGSKYESQSLYLGDGDILVTKSAGHTVVVVGNGSKYEGSVGRTEYKLGDRLLKHGSYGKDVKLLQTWLIQLGYDCGSYGADGDFGDATEIALKRFQRDHKLDDDGQYGPKSHAALTAAIEAEAPAAGKKVKIVNGSCYVRTAPNTDGKILGVAVRGAILDYQGEISENGWHLVIWDGQNAWVSGKYSKVVS